MIALETFAWASVTTFHEPIGTCGVGADPQCGSNEELEFDHIVPIALGGSNTERNVQLLCSACNREKGASL